jgi:SSS family solute:Na+ symporter
MVKAKLPVLISPLIEGKQSLIMKWPWRYVDALVVALPVCLVVTIVVSLITPRMNDEHLDRCFRGISKER